MNIAQLKILVVDDEPSTRLLMTDIFGRMDLQVSTATEGFTALASIRLNVPDIILSDLNMPGMSGFELLSVVRRRFPGIYVIASSGAFAGDTQPWVAADAFYPKASGLAALLRIVSRVLPDRLPRLTSLSCFAPIWINRDSPDGPVTIACPDCLRTFPQTLTKAAALIRETACHFCNTLIHYAIVPSTNPASPSAFQARTALPHPARAPSNFPQSGIHISRQ